VKKSCNVSQDRGNMFLKGDKSKRHGNPNPPIHSPYYGE